MPERLIQVGAIGRPHGVRGLVHVTSYTADPADLTAYGPLSDAHGRLFALRWKAAGVAEVSIISEGVTARVADRTGAAKLTNTRLFIDRSALPPEDDDEFYLADLIGLSAVDLDGGPIGTVSVVHDYGAGASLEIDRGGAASIIVPFTRACVPDVDIAAGRVVVVAPDEVVVPPAPDEVVVPPVPGEVVVPPVPGEVVVPPVPDEVMVPPVPGEVVVPPAGGAAGFGADAVASDAANDATVSEVDPSGDTRQGSYGGGACARETQRVTTTSRPLSASWRDADEALPAFGKAGATV